MEILNPVENTIQGKACHCITILYIEPPKALIGEMHQNNHKLKFTAKKNLLLTDFGLTPPTVLLGMVKVHNEITLEIDVYLSTYSTPTF
jgi:hypothetical protein